MRKMLSTITLLLLSFFFVGCSAESDNIVEQHITIYSSLSFNYRTMRFTTTNEFDILNATGDPFIDFIIVYNKTQVNNLKEEERILYDQLFTIFEGLNVQSVGTIYHFTSTEFKTQATANSINLTPTDIIMFNQYKQLLNNIETKYPSIYISKVDYIETQLNRNLSTTEIEQFELLQQYYYDVKLNYPGFDFKHDTFNDFITRIETITNEDLSTVDEDALTNAFLILQDLT